MNAAVGELPGGDPLDWLFLDLNSYFASVEQQERPELRGRPVIVVPVETDHTCAIAASYAAKKFGIKTGTMVGEARARCPGLVCVLARHDVYVDYHHRVLTEIDRHIPVTHIASIDEMACQLIGSLREPAAAMALARRLKAGLQRNVGEAITCSVGLAPNRFLAKVATDLQKPDGLVVLRASDVPVRLAGAPLRDLPGIGHNMERRLHAAGIYTMTMLWEAEPDVLRRAWGGVEGERFWFRLHGVEVPEPPPVRRSISHSHVLPPELRPSLVAEQVARRLALKTASRLRRKGYYATAMEVNVRVERGPHLCAAARFPATCDSPSLLKTLTGLWEQVRAAMGGGGRCKKVGVVLHGLVPADALRQLPLFDEAVARNPEETARRERASVAMDALNRKFGRDTVTLGMEPRKITTFTGTKIAFNRVPETEEFHE
jgi:DNA polymerase-4